MVTGKPLFPGRSNVDQLLCIFKVWQKKKEREREMFVGWLLSDMCEKTADGHAGRQELARRHRAARVGQHRLSQVITNQIVLLDSF
jgi:hypothetical protein